MYSRPLSLRKHRLLLAFFNKGVLEDCDHNIGNEIRKAKGAPEGGECSLEHVIMEDDSEEFNFTDWVEEQKKKIRETEKS